MNIVPKISRHSRPAFTLIELLVVIAIIVLLVAVSIPALKILGKSNGQKQAVNLLTSLIANAHSNALQTHALSGVVIYEDPTNKNQSAVQLIAISSSSYTTASGLVTNFVRIPHTVAQMLPQGIKVATLDDSSNTSAVAFKSENSSSITTCRVILFDENGQMVLRKGIAVDPVLTDASAVAWNLHGDGTPSNLGVSSPGIVVYNGSDLKAAIDAGLSGDANLSAWLNQHADIVILNAYTGNVIR